MDGIIDNPISPNARDVGECIYCGARDGPLSTEHAVPYGLNGPWTLLRASCAPCARITTKFEHGVMRHLWPDVRNVLAMQSRRPDKRSPTCPLVLQRNAVQETVQVDRTKYPTYIATPLFPPPAALWNPKPVRGVFWNLEMIHLCGPTFREVSKDYPGCGFVGMRTNFSAEEFGRLLAKIGLCAGVAAVGLGAFTNTPLRSIILGTDQCIGHWSGAGGVTLSIRLTVDCMRSRSCTANREIISMRSSGSSRSLALPNTTSSWVLRTLRSLRVPIGQRSGHNNPCLS